MKVVNTEYVTGYEERNVKTWRKKQEYENGKGEIQRKKINRTKNNRADTRRLLDEINQQNVI